VLRASLQSCCVLPNPLKLDHKSKPITINDFHLLLSWIKSFFSTKNVSFTPLRALATNTFVIVAKKIFNHNRRPKHCRVLNQDFPTRSSTQKLIPISHHGHYLQSNPCIGSKSLTMTRDWKLKKKMKQSV
jgi:hypothetical protein